MELRMQGTIRSIQQEFPSRKTLVTLEVGKSPADVEKLKDKVLTVLFKPFRSDRTKEANAYYWELCSQIAAARKISKTEEHNRLLSEYGQESYTDGMLDWVVKAEDYNTEEMAQLIDGACYEAKVHGIDPATPDERAKMMAAWEESNAKAKRGQEVCGGSTS